MLRWVSLLGITVLPQIDNFPLRITLPRCLSGYAMRASFQGTHIPVSLVWNWLQTMLGWRSRFFLRPGYGILLEEVMLFCAIIVPCNDTWRYVLAPSTKLERGWKWSRFRKPMNCMQGVVYISYSPPPPSRCMAPISAIFTIIVRWSTLHILPPNIKKTSALMLTPTQPLTIACVWYHIALHCTGCGHGVGSGLALIYLALGLAPSTLVDCRRNFLHSRWVLSARCAFSTFAAKLIWALGVNFEPST